MPKSKLQPKQGSGVPAKLTTFTKLVYTYKVKRFSTIFYVLFGFVVLPMEDNVK